MSREDLQTLFFAVGIPHPTDPLKPFLTLQLLKTPPTIQLFKNSLCGCFPGYFIFTNCLVFCCSPVYIDGTANIKIAAKRILWGKCVNAGQTCIAPDYILCSRQVQNQFLKEAETILREFYGDKPKDSPDLCRIISERHYKSVHFVYLFLNTYLFFY